jgi:hypothetical protein
MLAVTTASTQVVIDPRLTKEAFDKKQEIIALGQEKETLSRNQRDILIWFSQDISRLVAAGYESFWDMIRDPEIATALWGKEVVGAATRNRLIRLVEVQLQVPERDLFTSLPRSVTSSPAMPQLEQVIRSLPPVDSEDRKDALRNLDVAIADINAKTWRQHSTQNVIDTQTNYGYDPKRRRVFAKKDNEVVLEILGDCDELSARLLTSIFHSRWDGIEINSNRQVVAWKDGQPKVLATVHTKNKVHLNMLADMLHAERKF